jgi:hypothetical protein
MEVVWGGEVGGVRDVWASVGSQSTFNFVIDTARNVSELNLAVWAVELVDWTTWLS